MCLQEECVFIFYYHYYYLFLVVSVSMFMPPPQGLYTAYYPSFHIYHIRHLNSSLSTHQVTAEVHQFFSFKFPQQLLGQNAEIPHALILADDTHL